jgi:hypothetical protein
MLWGELKNSAAGSVTAWQHSQQTWDLPKRSAAGGVRSDHYRWRIVYIRHILTHAEYDEGKWKL